MTADYLVIRDCC